MTDRSTIKGRD